jgi:uncharacterized protein YidB (DUF937 family)
MAGLGWIGRVSTRRVRDRWDKVLAAESSTGAFKPLCCSLKESGRGQACRSPVGQGRGGCGSAGRGYRLQTAVLRAFALSAALYGSSCGEAGQGLFW